MHLDEWMFRPCSPVSACGFFLRPLDEKGQELDACLGDIRARCEDRHGTVLVEIIVVLHGDNAADADHDVVAAELLQLIYQLRQERVVSCSERAEPDHVHVVVDRILRRLCRRLEERAHIDVPAHVGEGGCDDLL